MAELVPVRIGGRVISYRPGKPPKYDGKLKAELEAEAKSRGLDATGTKAEIAAALEADDRV